MEEKQIIDSLAMLAKGLEAVKRYPVVKFNLIYLREKDALLFKLYPGGKELEPEPYQGQSKEMICHILLTLCGGGIADGEEIDGINISWEQHKVTTIVLAYKNLEKLASTKTIEIK